MNFKNVCCARGQTVEGNEGETDTVACKQPDLSEFPRPLDLWQGVL